jgi:hypothetical protein
MTIRSFQRTGVVVVILAPGYTTPVSAKIAKANSDMRATDIEVSAARRGGGHAGAAKANRAGARTSAARSGEAKNVNRRGNANRNANVNRNRNTNRNVNRNVSRNVNVVRPVRPLVARPYYGTIVGGVALGTVIAVTAAGAAPAPPAANMCWFWSDANQMNGYWDYCQAP